MLTKSSAALTASLQVQSLCQPVHPRSKVESQSLDHFAGHTPLDSRVVGRWNNRYSLPVISTFLSHLNHTSRQVRITQKSLLLLQAQGMAMLLVFHQSSRLDEHHFQPLLMHLQILLRVGQIGVDVGEGVCEEPVDESGSLVIEMRIDTGRAEPYNRRYLCLWLRHTNLHQGNNDGLRGVLSDVGAGHVVVTGDRRKDGVGVLEA